MEGIRRSRTRKKKNFLDDFSSKRRKKEINDTSGDWRVTSKTVNEKMKHVLTQSILTDFTIRVVRGTVEEFKVHSVFLAMASAVFESMMSPNFTESSTRMIEISDTRPEIFRLLIQHIYGQVVQIPGIDEAWELYTIADYYLIHDLKEYCIEYIETKMDPSNTCFCIEMADYYNLPSVKERCLQIIKRETKAVVTDESFCKVNKQMVQMILDQEQLNVKESVLFEAVAQWIKSKGKELRQQLCDLLIPKFRFLNMTAEEFTEGPMASSLIKQSDAQAILGSLSSPQCSAPFPKKFRKTKRINRNEVKTDAAKKSVTSFSRNMIIFTVNKDIRLIALNLFTLEGEGEEGEKYDEEISVSFWLEGCSSSSNCTTLKTEAEYSSTILVQLCQPCLLENGRRYVLYIRTNPRPRKTVSVKRVKICNEDVTFTFYKHPGYSTFPISSLIYD